jgi:hypothetical protein
MATPPIIATECPLDDLREQIRREPGTLYAILDACDEPRVPKKTSELGPQRAVSLYRGSAEEDYWAFAPYLVQADEPLLVWIIENLWRDPWGIVAVAPVDLAALRTHFRRFLTVLDPEGRNSYFRYYDPRVLPTFLENCTREELQQFFGPIRAFYVTASGGGLVRFQPSQTEASQPDFC